MDDRSFRALLQGLQLSWRGYRRVRKGVQRRLTRHMRELNCRSMEEYLSALGRDPEEEKRARVLLSVPISRFLRDRRLWEVLGERVLPELVHTAPPSGVRVWSAGCASGEEVYSFRILWEEMASFRPPPPLDFLATDLNPELIDRGRAGIYGPGSLKEVPEALRTAYFSQIGPGRFSVREDLKGCVRWAVHDVTQGAPPGRGFQLVFLRNSLLTYYEEPIQRASLVAVTDALESGGFLVIGNHETLPAGDLPLESFSGYRCIFRKPSISGREIR